MLRASVQPLTRLGLSVRLTHSLGVERGANKLTRFGVEREANSLAWG
jgi:hypothetical protein